MELKTKLQILGLILMGFLAGMIFTTQVSACTDSDGIDYYIKGTTIILILLIITILFFLVNRYGDTS
jgi:hypothetical protein